jgi:hypothetical protein
VCAVAHGLVDQTEVDHAGEPITPGSGQIMARTRS